MTGGAERHPREVGRVTEGALAAAGVRTAAVVAPSPVPLRLGGAERHWETLRRSLEQAGVAADLVKLPVREHNLVDLLDGYEAFRLLDLSHVDVVITGKYPAWMVRHPNHVVWMLHPLRGLYDTYRPAAHEGLRLPDISEFGVLAELLRIEPVDADPLEVIDAVRAVHARLGPASTEAGGLLSVPSPIAAAVVRLLDHWALHPVRIRRHFAISGIVAERPGYFPEGVEATVITPPSCLPDPPEATDPGAGLLSVGRLDGPKRIDLSIRAMSGIDDPSTRLSVLGDGPEAAALRDLAAQDERIRFGGRVDDTELAEAYCDARAVLVTPEDEDFGYVAIEALQAGRPVITTTDSGGPAALVTDGVDGVVTHPDPAAIAAASARLLDDDDLAARMGRAGRETAARFSWPNAVIRLLSPPDPTPPSPGRRGRVVALSTYPVAEWPGGGPQRARHLLGGLADDGWEVEVIAIAPGDEGGHHTVGTGFDEMTVPRSARHAAAERRLRRLTADVAVTDIVGSVLWRSTPELVGALARSLRGASLVVAVQPYLAQAALALAPEVPLVVDSHNHELALKTQILPHDEAGQWMLDRVSAAEGTAVARAALVVATTASDARALEAENDLPPGSIAVVPNGVDTTVVRFTPPARRAELRDGLRASLRPGDTTHVSVFVGSAHRPNIDAADEILDLAPQMPDVLFALAGEHADQIHRVRIPENVRLLGTVTRERLAELLAGADVALNPMRTGGGSNLKVVQFFAAGIPVLSTPLGVRGIPDAARYAEVTGIDRFGEALAGLLAESPRGGSSGRVDAARRLAEAEFDWEVLAGTFAGLVGDTVEEPERTQ